MEVLCAAPASGASTGDGVSLFCFSVFGSTRGCRSLLYSDPDQVPLQSESRAQANRTAGGEKIVVRASEFDTSFRFSRSAHVATGGSTRSRKYIFATLCLPRSLTPLSQTLRPTEPSFTCTLL